MNRASLMKEEWRDVCGYEGLYMVSNFGRVKSLRGWNGHRYIERERVMRPTTTGNGEYLFSVVRLSNGDNKRTVRLHRLVASAFLPHDGHRRMINHKDFNALNNKAENLEWCTQKENMQWSADHWRMISVSGTVAAEMVALYNNGMSALDISGETGVPEHVVYNALKKCGVPRRQKTDHLNKYHIDMDDLLRDFKKGMKNCELQSKYRCSKDIIATRKYQFRKQGLL